MRRRPGACAAGWAPGWPGGCAPTRRSSRAGSRPTPRRARPSSTIFKRHRPDCGGALDRRGLPRRPRDGALRRHGEEIAARLRREVREEVGLPISVGVAETKFLAKVASAVAKPDGLLVVPPGGELAFLHPLPAERLWGVGPVTSERLRDSGIRTVRQVAELPERTLVELLGRGAGRHLHALANNRDPRRVRCGAGGGRSGRNTRSAGGRARRRRWTPRLWRLWTAPAGAFGPRTASAGRWCCGCASKTSSAPPALTP